jgi:hypothetical protein
MKRLILSLTLKLSAITLALLFVLSARADDLELTSNQEVSEYTMEQQILEEYFNTHQEEVKPIIPEGRMVKVYDIKGNLIAQGKESEVRIIQWMNRSDYLTDIDESLIYMVD